MICELQRSVINAAAQFYIYVLMYTCICVEYYIWTNAEFYGDIPCLFTDKAVVEHTGEQSCIISRLQEQTTYTVRVCAATSKGKGPPAVLECTTADLGEYYC